MRKLLALIAVVALFVLTGCVNSAPAQETIAPTIEIMPAVIAPFEKQANASINEIDMSAPENGKYRDWLEIHFSTARPEFRPTLPKPSKRRKTNRPNDKAFNKWKRETLTLSGWRYRANESWQTWDWSDAWELELYEYSRGYIEWHVLRARNKVTDETQIITETFSDTMFDGAYSRPSLVKIIDESHLLYQVTGYDIFSLHFYTLEQGTAPINRDRYTEWGFADEKCTYLYWTETDYDPVYSQSLCCADLQKLTEGDSDAIWAFTSLGGMWGRAFSPDGRYVTEISVEGDGELSQRYFTICDISNGRKTYFGQLPEMPSGAGWANGPGVMAWADENTLYYWEHIYSYNPESRLFYSASGIYKTVEQVVLYEIRCEF